jgi:hypothetical protein
MRDAGTLSSSSTWLAVKAETVTIRSEAAAAARACSAKRSRNSWVL